MNKSLGQRMFRGVCDVVMVSVWIASSGCGEFMGYNDMTRSTREAQAKARQPYYGTGVVTRVHVASLDWPARIEINFSPSSPPSVYTPLIIVRTNGIIGKVKMNGDSFPPSAAGADILEGEARVGDMALGVIHEMEFPKQKLPKAGGKTP